MHAPFVPGRSERWRWMFLDLRAARATLAIAFICLAVHGLTVVLAANSPTMEARGFYALFGLSREGLLGGKVWQLVTHAFLHGNGLHIAINLMVILLIGARVERIGGAAMVLKVFFAGVVTGGLAQMFLSSPVHRGEILVGASGGATALLLWLTTVSPESRMWPVPVSGRNLGLGILIAEALLLGVDWVAPISEIRGLGGVAHGCHFGGALAGWWLAFRLLRPTLTLENLKKERARRETANEPGS